MLKLKDIIELKAIDSSNRLSFATRYLVQVNFTFDLTVKSDLFSGTAHFCVRKDELEKLCNELNKMTESFNGACRLQDNDSDGFIEFAIGSTRKVGIYGQLGGTHEDNFMQYKFTSDLSATETFIAGMTKLLTHVDNAEYEKEYNLKYKQK
ncbi:MAG: hypothetical protein IPG89_04745 [Bacteroidetes bacterium]|nr:hypothetical protein [Bacteroidota bacterium]